MKNYCFTGVEEPARWTIAGILQEQAERCGDRIAIQFVDADDWSFADCLTHGLAMAALLRKQQVQPGTRVAVFCNDPQIFCRYWFGLSLLGATMVAINTAVRGKSLHHQLSTAEVTVLLTDDELHCHAQSVQSASFTCLRYNDLTANQTSALNAADLTIAQHSDIACIMFTSGTSGPSKGVLMPHAHCVMFAVGTMQNMALKSDDAFYILFHANGLFMQLLACLLTGARAVVRRKFSVTEWLTDIRRYQITHTNTLGAVAGFIADSPFSLNDRDHRLRVMGAAPLPARVEQLLRDRFGVLHVIPLYGMTEVNIPLYGKLNERAPGTCGLEYSRFFEVSIRDPETDEALDNGSVGELMVRPKMPFAFMAGYAGMPEKTVDATRNYWFHTGDAAFRRDDGHFVFVDRIKDCIRRRGENISSFEVEQAFEALPEVTEAAACAVPADGGEGMEDEVMLVLILNTDQPVTTELLRILRERTAANLPTFALPRYIRIVKELPRTPTGKVRKAELRDQGVTDETCDFDNLC